MKYHLTQRFYFEAAHTLQREIEAEGSRRIHGHTYIAEVTLSGAPQGDSGMVLDLGFFKQHLETVRERLDHHLLNEVEGLGKPTLENLCAFIWAQLQGPLPQISRVVVRREASGDACALER